MSLDHFRGFAGYWEVPAGAASAREGRWVTGPGLMLFLAIRHALGDVPIVAEDLGEITDDVRQLLATLGVPGMKVLQFAFGEMDSEHLPHHHVPNAVVYSGTHDNDTAAGWYAAQPDWAQERFREYFGVDGKDPAGVLVRAAYASVADRAVVPLQDVLGLGSEARMNVPGARARQLDLARSEGRVPARGRVPPAPPRGADGPRRGCALDLPALARVQDHALAEASRRAAAAIGLFAVDAAVQPVQLGVERDAQRRHRPDDDEDEGRHEKRVDEDDADRRGLDPEEGGVPEEKAVSAVGVRGLRREDARQERARDPADAVAGEDVERVVERRAPAQAQRREARAGP